MPPGPPFLLLASDVAGTVLLRRRCPEGMGHAAPWGNAGNHVGTLVSAATGPDRPRGASVSGRPRGHCGKLVPHRPDHGYAAGNSW